VSTTPSDLPGPPPAQPSGSPTQIAGQEVAPSTTVPYGPSGPSGAIYRPAAGTTTNTLAIVSLGTGIGSFFAHIVLPGVGGFMTALIAVVTGYMARKQIRETGEQGMGIATTGMVIGIAHLALIALAFIAVLFAIFALGVVLFNTGRH
jgi:hypothetical protein